MGRSLAMMMLAVTLSLPAVDAQARRGRGGFSGRGGFGSVNTFSGRARLPFGGYPSLGYDRSRQGFGHLPYYGFYYPLLLTWTAYGPPYTALDYRGGYPQPAPPSPELDVSTTKAGEDLANEVRRLSQEIEGLRQEGTLPASLPPPPLPPKPGAAANPRVLVFRDGHRLEIYNYAVVGNTLTVLDPKSSPRIPLSDLDLARTQRENNERGVRLPLP